MVYEVMQFDLPFLLVFCVIELKFEFFEFPNFERTGLCDIKKLLQIYNLYIKFVLKSTFLYRKFGVHTKAFVAGPPKIVDNVISSSSPSVMFD